MSRMVSIRLFFALVFAIACYSARTPAAPLLDPCNEICGPWTPCDNICVYKVSPELPGSEITCGEYNGGEQNGMCYSLALASN
jgi:hypothetical protein